MPRHPDSPHSAVTPFQPAPSEVLLYDPDRARWLYFHRPEQIVSAWQSEDVLAALEEVERQVTRTGRYAAGFLLFEAAPAFDRAFQVKASGPADLPLLWFGLYSQPALIPSSELALAPGTSASGLFAAPWVADIDEDRYGEAISQIKDWIARGDTYQVNFTYRLKTASALPAWPVFASLWNAYPAPYAAFLETEAWAIASISPELFFTLDGATLTSRPMKGTAPRGRTPEEDRELAEWLATSEKNRAENVMIVDMVRNDLGRIARTGTVQVPRLFQIEKYPTVWQMTSTVQAETGAGLKEILRNLFPAASITGAPKIRTMQLIAGLEQSRRGIYTGAMGYFAPQRRAQFNVAIRTLYFDKANRQVEYGVGGGIVWDSEAASEWQESKDKARILSEPPQPFELLETLRWSPEEGWFLLDYHLQRLARSADYFAYSFDQAEIAAKLAEAAEDFVRTPPGAIQRARLTLDRDGRVRLECEPFTPAAYPAANPARLGLAKTPVQSSYRFLFHKTTRREIYQRARAERPDCDETLLWNERGEATEACIANLVVRLEGELVTPSLDCGLLPGVYRAWLLDRREVRERVIRLEELKGCSELFLINSVRGMWPVQIDWEPASG